MKRATIFAYGLLSYALCGVTFLYAIGFVGNIVVPKSIDSAPTVPLGLALLADTALLALFAVQHSGMARPAFKRWLTRFVPAAAERSTYVLASNVCLGLLMAAWAPLGGVVWNLEGKGAVALTGLYLASWALLLYATFLIDHFDLFGLRQVWFALRGRPAGRLRFVTPALYRIIRHPIDLGWLGILWLTPTMTMSHLLFAVGSTAYIFLGIRFEERDLAAMHPEYSQYRVKVPALVPSFSRHLDRESEVRSR